MSQLTVQIVPQFFLQVVFGGVWLYLVVGCFLSGGQLILTRPRLIQGNFGTGGHGSGGKVGKGMLGGAGFGLLENYELVTAL